MSTETIGYPKKERELHSHHFDSTIWNDFTFRDDDIVIATYAKSGTTWVQQIIAQLIFRGQEGINVADMSPWLDLRVPPAVVKLQALENQQHRRFIKTHLPVDALVFSPKAKYLYIGRDGRDVVWSLYNHHANGNALFYEALNDTPGRVGPPLEKPNESIVEYFREWLQKDGYPFWSFWENIKTWWDIRQLPNVMLIHFAELKRDMPGQIKSIAKFLDIKIADEDFDKIVEHCSFDYMKNNAGQSAPLNGAFWEGGAQTFINKGTNDRWKDLLTEEDSRLYESLAEEHLGKEAAQWLKTGIMP